MEAKGVSDEYDDSDYNAQSLNDTLYQIINGLENTN